MRLGTTCIPGWLAGLTTNEVCLLHDYLDHLMSVYLVLKITDATLTPKPLGTLGPLRSLGPKTTWTLGPLRPLVPLGAPKPIGLLPLSYYSPLLFYTPLSYSIL